MDVSLTVHLQALNPKEWIQSEENKPKLTFKTSVTARRGEAVAKELSPSARPGEVDPKEEGA